ncbi:MAG: L-histidine N(alpha)-methyltransferase [Cyclobacteriaceae bacterium]
MSHFGSDVREGLTSKPKFLSSKYFYDKHGDELFREIMELDEYYLTRSEFSIFRNEKQRIQELIAGSQPFRLIELGAGDGAKTMVLLEHFFRNHIDFTFCPIDISPHVLNILEENVKTQLPGVSIEPMVGDYFKILHDIKEENHQRNIVFFLGSNIGNFPHDLALSFLGSVAQNLNPKDMMMIGVDLKKDPAVILNAYNDKQGVTSDFNLNLLARINRELDADFDLSCFKHYPAYNPLTGECISYLISQKDQIVHVRALDLQVQFKRWEPMKMEISRKFDLEDIHELAEGSGFNVVETLYDKDKLFAESVWEVK